MKRSLILSYFILISFTIFSGLIASFNYSILPKVGLILFLSVCKFLVVSFQFMELKKANSFWKGSLLLVLFLLMGIILFVKIS